MSSTDEVAAGQSILTLLHFADRYVCVVTRTKVAKLLYLADLRAIERFGEPGSGIEWHWLQYGPFDNALLQLERDLIASGQVRRDAITNFYGTPEYRFTLCSIPQVEIDTAFARIIAEVVMEYGQLAPSSLRDLTYQTAPMIDAQENGAQGEILDLYAERPVPDVQPALRRMQRVLQGLEQQETDDEAAAELAQEVEDLTALRARANRALLD